MLATGERFKVKLNATGSFAYTDVADALTQGVIEVAADAPAARSLYLPVVTR